MAGILACQAGKHAYVEKPISHNLREGRLLVDAARKYKRIVSGGTQRRSHPNFQHAIQLIHDGLIGDIYMTRWLLPSHRPSIGFKKPETPPSSLHWDLWRGPAPDQPYHGNLVHYNWHWFWDFGNGEMATTAAIRSTSAAGASARTKVFRAAFKPSAAVSATAIRPRRRIR